MSLSLTSELLGLVDIQVADKVVMTAAPLSTVRTAGGKC